MSLPDLPVLADVDLRAALAGDNGPVPKIEPAKRGGFTVCLAKRWVHGKYDPVKDATRQLAEVKAPRGPLHIHFGFGLGYLAAADPPASGGRLLVYEPNPGLLKAALNHQSLQSHFRIPGLHLSCEPRHFKRLLRDHMDHDMPVRVVLSQFHRQAYPEALQAFLDWLKDERNSKTIAHVTQTLGARRFYQSTLRSLPLSRRRPGVALLEPGCRNRPAVIVAAGPSLDGNIPDLIPFKDRVLIFALSRTAAVLAHAGIAPHFLVHNESQDMDHHLKGLTNLAQTHFLLADQAHVGYYRHTHGGTFVYQNPMNRVSHYVGKALPALARAHIPSGGSVANDAFALAFLLGCNPIVLIGQDLAQSRNRYYATAETNQRFTHGDHEITTTPGYFGGRVQTTVNYKAFQTWTEEAVAAYAAHDPTRIFINATEGGAAIAGFQHMRLRHAAYKWFQKRVASPNPKTAEPLSEEEMMAFLKRERLAVSRLDETLNALSKVDVNADQIIALKAGYPLVSAFNAPPAESSDRNGPEMLLDLKASVDSLTQTLEEIEHEGFGKRE